MRRPNGYWTLETLKDSAKPHHRVSDWSKTDMGAYIAARRLGLFKQVTEHMLSHGESISRSRTKWTKAKCLASAARYTKRFDWEKGDPPAYSAAKKHGWYDECVAHMALAKQRNGYWNFENCLEEARKYKTITEWLAGSASCYQAAKSRPDWFEACTEHMVRLWEKKWTSETISEDASKYQILRDWATSSTGYSAALKLGVVEAVTQHMEKRPKWFGVANIHRVLKSHDIEYIDEQTFEGCRDKRKLPFDFYLPWFNLLIEHHGGQHQRGWQGAGAEDIGRRDLIKRRFAESNGFNFLEIREWEVQGLEQIENVILRVLLKVNPQFVPMKRELSEAESDACSRRHNFDLGALQKIASQYRTRADFKRGNEPAYNFACRHEYIDEICGHMLTKYQAQSEALQKWNKDAVIASAKHYRTSREWCKNEGAAYNAARKNGWLDEASAHFPSKLKSKV
jgi:very-short-patch-repair endonuclease